MPSKKFIPIVSPTTFLNSGSKDFTAQQASINKIIFFKQENDLEYSAYVAAVNQANSVVKPSVPNSNFPNQGPSANPDFPPTNTGFVFRAGN